MENLTFTEAIHMITISIGVLLLVIGVMVWYIGFEKPFDSGEYYQDKDDPNLFYSRHSDLLSCHIKSYPKDRDLIMIYFTLPHCLTARDMSHLIRYAPQLSDYEFVEQYPESGYVVALRKSQGIYWRDIQHKILEFFFCKLYKEYSQKVKETTTEVG